MGQRLVENIELALGSLVLVSPILAAVGLCIWAHRLASRGRLPLAPVLIAVAVTVGGATLVATASDGLAGIGEVLAGLALAGLGGLTTVVCLAMAYAHGVFAGRRTRH